MSTEPTDGVMLELPDFGPCIYFLYDGDEIVYVGQTHHFLGRMQHHRNKGKVFNRVRVIPCAADCLDSEELRWINELKPKYNCEYRRSEFWPSGPRPHTRGRRFSPEAQAIINGLRGSDDEARPIIDRPVTALPLSTRTLSALVSAGVTHVRQLIPLDANRLLSFPGFGERALTQTVAAVEGIANAAL